MTTRNRTALIAAVLASSVALVACKKTEAPAPAPTAVAAEPTAVPTAVPAAITVTDLSLGKSLGADKKVQAATDTFSPKDTIFAVVSTDGSAPSSVIGVKWTYGDGQTVKEDSKTIAPTGPTATEFSIQKPKGWPKGNYKVETTVDGKPGPSKTFTVK